MNEPVQEVSPNQVFAILGSKEVELQLLRARIEALLAKHKELDAKIKELEEKLAPTPPPAP